MKSNTARCVDSVEDSGRCSPGVRFYPDHSNRFCPGDNCVSDILAMNTENCSVFIDTSKGYF